MAVLSAPYLLFALSALKPIAVLLLPLSRTRTPFPNAVFPVGKGSQICGHCAWVSCGSQKKVTATTSWVRRKALRRGERFIEFVVRGRVVFDLNKFMVV